MTRHRHSLLVLTASALAVSVLVFALLGSLRDRESTVDEREPDGRIGQAAWDDILARQLPGGVAAYVAECGGGRDLPEEPVALHMEVTRCVAGLTTAIVAIVSSDTAGSRVLDYHLTVHRQHIERLLEQGGGLPPPGVVREILGSQALLLAHLWEERYRDLPRLAREVAGVRRAVRLVDEQRPLSDQRGEVDEALNRAGDALFLMATEEMRRTDPE